MKLWVSVVLYLTNVRSTQVSPKVVRVSALDVQSRLKVSFTKHTSFDLAMISMKSPRSTTGMLESTLR